MDDLISRRAVIDAVHTATYGFICGAEDGDEMTEADKLVLSFNKAVCNAIKALPTEPNTSNALSALDCVERHAAIDALAHKWDGMVTSVFDVIKELPSVQQCETCRYAGLEWDEEPCDSCTRGGETNHYKPSVQPEHLVKESGNLVKGLVNDCISRKAAIDAVNGMPDCPNGYSDTYDKAHIIAVLEDVPSAQQDAINDFWVGFIYGAYIRGTE